jgi:hypothetical protein
VQLVFTGNGEWHLKSDSSGSTPVADATTKVSATIRMTPDGGVRIPLPALEIDQSLSSLTPPNDGVTYADAEILTKLPNQPPIPGSRTNRFRIVRCTHGDHRLTLVVEGEAGTEGIVSVIRNTPVIPKVQSGSADASAFKPGDVSLQISDERSRSAVPLIFHFPPGEGWKTLTVTLTW